MSTFIDNMRRCIDKEAQDVVKLLCEKNLQVSTAESCTGGLLSGAIVGVSGSSEVFGLGICAYANEMKEKFLGVSAEILEKYGAVSEACAAEMAKGAQQASGAGTTAGGIIGISTTGIAGPCGGTEEKPVGTVFICCSYKEKQRTLHLRIENKGREYIRLETVRQALILILNTID